jgi:hypothetical protein
MNQQYTFPDLHSNAFKSDNDFRTRQKLPFRNMQTLGDQWKSLGILPIITLQVLNLFPTCIAVGNDSYDILRRWKYPVQNEALWNPPDGVYPTLHPFAVLRI